MALKWFIQTNDVVSGPHSTEDIRSRLDAGQIAPKALIWGDGMDFWQTMEWWTKELPNLGNRSQVETLNDSWHYAYNNESFGPFSRSKLVEELKNHPGHKDILLWTNGMKEWAPMYDFHDILTSVGVNKRQFPRAEVKGQVVIKAEGLTLVAPIVMVGEGGLSVQLESDLVPGQIVGLEISSPSLPDIVRARGECRHSRGGVMGIRFVQISAEDQAAIVQFVKQALTKFVLRPTG